MRYSVSVMIFFILGSFTTAVGQEAVRGIPSFIDQIESNGNGIVCAMSGANRVYLSRDGGKNFIAIDTTDLIAEPWIENRKWLDGRTPLLHFDAKNDFVWVRSQKGGVLCRHNLRTGEWSAPIPYEEPYSPPSWITHCLTSGAERTVVVAIGGSTEALGDYNYALRSDDAGDTWKRLPDMDSTGLEKNPWYQSFAVLPDGSLLASIEKGAYDFLGGIYRLAAGDSVWKLVFAKDNSSSADTLLLCGTTVYAWNRTGAKYSDDLGQSFSPVSLGVVKSLTAAPYRGDTIAFIVPDTSSRRTSVIGVYKGDIIDTLQSSIKHSHLAPFVRTISDSVDPKIFVSGNGVTGSMSRGEVTPVRAFFSPETYVCFLMCRVSTGLVVYARGQGLYRIDRGGVATLDTSITYRLRRRPQDVWSSNEDGLILNLGLVYVYCFGGRMDTIIQYPIAPDIGRYPVLIRDSVVYAGAHNQGVEEFHLSDTATRRMISEGMPTFGGVVQGNSSNTSPMGFIGRWPVVLAGWQSHKPPYSTSSDGGMFIVENEVWTRVNDVALGSFRLPFSTGDCLRGICTFRSYKQISDGPRVFYYSDATNAVEQISEVSDSTVFYESTVVDNNHIAMSGMHDTLRVVELSTKNMRNAIVGVPLEVSTLNGKVAVSTVRDGILIYPLDALTSVSTSEHSASSSLKAWYSESTREIKISLGQQTSNNAVVYVVNTLGQVVTNVELGTQSAGASIRINVDFLTSGCYIVVLKDPMVSMASTAVLISR